jgi:hypothetical protein
MKIFTKSTFALLAFVCFSQLVSAQTVGQGAWMIGGSAGLDIDNPKPDAFESTTSWFLNPVLGYFIADDLAIGTGLTLGDSGFEGSETLFGVGPFVRYYVTDPIFIQVGGSFILNEGGGSSIGASVGYSWFLNDGLAIEPALYFQSYGNEGDALDGTSFGLSIGIQGFLHHDHGME